MKKIAILTLSLGILFSTALLIPTSTALAAPLDISEQEGFGSGGEIPEAFGQSGSSQPKTPAQVIVRIINILLSFIGLLLVIFLIYAGFLWMTAAGDESKVEKAMGIIKNSIIGLVIILAAWSISYFVIQKLDEATGGSKNVRIV
jgi:hypothetical protein